MKYEIKKITYITSFVIGDNNVSQDVIIKVGIFGDTYDFTKDVYHTVENIPKNYTINAMMDFITESCDTYTKSVYPDTEEIIN